MTGGIFKKILAFIVASSSIILALNCQAGFASYSQPITQKKLKFAFPNDKEIFVETFNNMLECTETCEPLKDDSSEFTISDYNALKDYILLADDLDQWQKESAILSCVRSLRKTLQGFPKRELSQRRAKRFNKVFPYNRAEISFVSHEDKLAFLDFYNVMCFYEEYELFGLFFNDTITWQDVLDVKEFYQKKDTFYSVESIQKILNLVDRTIAHSSRISRYVDLRAVLESSSSSSCGTSSSASSNNSSESGGPPYSEQH